MSDMHRRMIEDYENELDNLKRKIDQVLKLHRSLVAEGIELPDSEFLMRTRIYGLELRIFDARQDIKDLLSEGLTDL